MMPAVAWWGYGIAIALLILLLGSMYALVKIMSTDSETYAEIKKMMDPLFHTPSFLRPGGESGGPDGKETAAAAEADVEPFEEACPACGETVTHRNRECPSCGLRLM